MKRSLGLMLCLVTTAVPIESQATDSARQIAESNVAQWNAAFAKGNMDGILALYADNALLVQPNGSVAKGRVRSGSSGNP